MTDYWVTFGGQYARQTHPRFPGAHPDGYLVIEAVSYEHARAATADLLGDAWSDIYGPGEWLTAVSRLFPRGELDRIGHVPGEVGSDA